MAARSQLHDFFVGAKTLKLNIRIYSNFTITFPTIWRCAGAFQGFVEIQNGRHESISILLRLQKLGRKLFKFYNHIPHDMEMCM